MNPAISNPASHNPADYPVTVLGLGNMGLALADALLKGGYPVTVWNRSPEKVKPLVVRGARLARTVGDAAAASPVVLVCLSTYEVTSELLEPAAGMLEGRLLINLTTGTPQDARQTARWAEEHGAGYLEGAIMAVPQMIGTPEALIFYGGPKPLFEAHQPMLKVLGGQAVYLSPDHGVPLLYDLALLTMLYGAWYSYFHAQALLRTADISATEFLPYAEDWLKHLIVPLLSDPGAAAALDRGDHATDVSNMNVNKQALDHIVQFSQNMEIPADWLLPIQALAARKVAEGYGQDAFTRVYEAIRG